LAVDETVLWAEIPWPTLIDLLELTALIAQNAQEGTQVSAALEGDGTIAVGDSVFVDPHKWAPVHLRGIQGIVVALAGVQAQLRPSSSPELLWVKAGILRRDRRRPRVPAPWKTAS